MGIFWKIVVVVVVAGFLGFFFAGIQELARE